MHLWKYVMLRCAQRSNFPIQVLDSRTCDSIEKNVWINTRPLRVRLNISNMCEHFTRECNETVRKYIGQSARSVNPLPPSIANRRSSLRVEVTAIKTSRTFKAVKLTFARHVLFQVFIVLRAGKRYAHHGPRASMHHLSFCLNDWNILPAVEILNQALLASRHLPRVSLMESHLREC